MRIAISGSHSLGKSTFVSDFLKAHPNYAFEEEPYRVLRHEHEIRFAEGQRCSDIELQLNYCIGQGLCCTKPLKAECRLVAV